jgi:hypothetical protein
MIFLLSVPGRDPGNTVYASARCDVQPFARLSLTVVSAALEPAVAHRRAELAVAHRCLSDAETAV